MAFLTGGPANWGVEQLLICLPVFVLPLLQNDLSTALAIPSAISHGSS